MMLCQEMQRSSGEEDHPATAVGLREKAGKNGHPGGPDRARPDGREVRPAGREDRETGGEETGRREMSQRKRVSSISTGSRSRWAARR